jgi:hypothetical protein
MSKHTDQVIALNTALTDYETAYQSLIKAAKDSAALLDTGNTNTAYNPAILPDEAKTLQMRLYAYIGKVAVTGKP